jgi:hypothetical protein
VVRDGKVGSRARPLFDGGFDALDLFADQALGGFPDQSGDSLANDLVREVREHTAGDVFNQVL